MNKFLPILIGVLLILIFGYNLIHFSINLPTFDDYDATLNFIKGFYFDGISFSQKLKLLFSFHNDHCILISRMVAAFFYGLSGEVNFAHLILFQNVFLFGFFFVILAIMRSQKLLSPWSALFVAVFLFNLSLWQVIFNYWGGIQTYTVFFFSSLGLLLLNKTEKPRDLSFIAAILSVMLAVFSFGNGTITLFLGAFLLWVRKKKAALLIWSLISSILLIFIFMGRMKSYGQPSEPFNFDWMARLLFTFAGSFLYVNPQTASLRHFNIIICMAVGVGILGFWAWLFFKKYPFQNPLLFTLLSLPLLTGILISISRFSTKAAGGIAPRYMFFSATIPIIVVLIMIDLKMVGKRSLPYLTSFALIIWATTFYYDRAAVEAYNQELISVVRKWTKDDRTPLVYYLDHGRQSETMHWALDEKVLRLPAEIRE